MSDAPGIPEPESLDVFRARRERLLSRLGNGVAVVPSAPELLLSRDTEVPYRPDSDLYYLTGCEEPQVVAVLTPHDPAHRFTLFVRPRDPVRESWSGPRIGVEAAAEHFGADAVYPIDELWSRLPELLRPASRVHFPLHDAELAPRMLELLVSFRRARQRSGQGPTGGEDLEPLLGELRRVKDAVEVQRIRTAAHIAAAAHREVMARARPGMGEWELQAILEAGFRSRGATRPAFPSIVGGGNNATVLHYVTNRDRVRDGDLVLVDAGAEWGMYCSDITRTFPVSGRFSVGQRELYELVLAAEEAGIAAARPDGTVQAIHEVVVRELTEGLVRLGLLEAGDVDALIESGAYRRFFLHQTSHWLGLDVHDVGSYQEAGVPVPLEPGMVLTIEPGLYIPADAEVPERFRGVGIRIEDDVLITPEGHEVLTRGVPVTVEEIEALVGSG